MLVLVSDCEKCNLLQYGDIMDRYFIFLTSQKFEMNKTVFNYIEQCFLSVEQYFIFVNNKSHYFNLSELLLRPENEWMKNYISRTPSVHYKLFKLHGFYIQTYPDQVRCLKLNSSCQYSIEMDRLVFLLYRTVFYYI
jgi:hypothetical protein